jgi:hypothetical protein
MVLDGFDPHNAPPRTRTTEDYLRERPVPPAE